MNNLDELIKRIEAAESDREVCLDGSMLCTSDDLKALAARVQHLEAASDKMHDALHEIDQWSQAYPLKPFPEPTKDDWADIAKVLRDAGFSLDRVSASNMRHVVTKVGEIARKWLAESGPMRETLLMLAINSIIAVFLAVFMLAVVFTLANWVAGDCTDAYSHNDTGCEYGPGPTLVNVIRSMFADLWELLKRVW